MAEQRILWLMRHADASPPIPGQKDFDRSLSPRGEQEVANVRDQLAALGVSADWMLVSSARRTTQTASVIAPALGLTPAAVEFLPELFHAPAATLFTAITSAPPTVRQLVVVAHNPGLSELATRCNQDQPIQLPTAGCCSFISRNAVDDWSSLSYASFEQRHRLKPDTDG